MAVLPAFQKISAILKPTPFLPVAMLGLLDRLGKQRNAISATDVTEMPLPSWATSANLPSLVIAILSLSPLAAGGNLLPGHLSSSVPS